MLLHMQETMVEWRAGRMVPSSGSHTIHTTMLNKCPSRSDTTASSLMALCQSGTHLIKLLMQQNGMHKSGDNKLKEQTKVLLSQCLHLLYFVAELLLLRRSRTVRLRCHLQVQNYR